MDDRTAFTQSEAWIKVDVPMMAALDCAIDQRLTKLETALRRARKPESRQAVENQIRNLKAGQAALDPVYRAALAKPLFTPEYEALIQQGVESASDTAEHLAKHTH